MYTVSMIMRTTATIILSLFSWVMVFPQTVINVQIEQNPQLTAVAETVTAELSGTGITLGSDLVVEGGDGSYTYLWTDDSGEELGTASTLSVTEPGGYYLAVTDGCQCSVSVKFTVTGTSGIDAVVADGFSVECVDGKLTVSSAKKIDSVRIVNASGQLVRLVKNGLSSGSFTLPLDNPRGVYIVCCVFDDGTGVVRQIIAK